MNLNKLGDEAYNQINTFYMKVKSGFKAISKNEGALLRVGTKTAVAAAGTLVFGAFMGASLGATITLAGAFSIGVFLYFTSQEASIRSKVKIPIPGMSSSVSYPDETSLIEDFEPMLKAAQSFYEIAQDKLDSWRASHRRRI